MHVPGFTSVFYLLHDLYSAISLVISHCEYTKKNTGSSDRFTFGCYYLTGNSMIEYTKATDTTA
jgi:hypothetical protein